MNNTAPQAGVTDALDVKALAAATEQLQIGRNHVPRRENYEKHTARVIKAYLVALEAASAIPVQVETRRPERVQAAFEVWENRPEIGPNASALFEYIEMLEAASLAQASAIPVQAQANFRKPIAIWTKETADLYRANSIKIQDAWDAYANEEAAIFDRDHGTIDRHVNVMHHWTPPLTFEMWLERRAALSPMANE